LLALLLLTGATTAVLVGVASEREIAESSWQRDLSVASETAVLFALVYGIVVVATEFRHGTITPTLLAAPVRERVLAAKGIVCAAGGVALAMVSLALTFAIALPWLSARGAPIHANALLSRNALGLLAAAGLWGALGVALGALIRSRVAAFAGTFVWLFVVEPLVAAVADVAGVEIGRYLPGSAVDALYSTSDGLLTPWAGLALTLGYVAVVGALGLAVFARRDVG